MVQCVAMCCAAACCNELSSNAMCCMRVAMYCVCVRCNVLSSMHLGADGVQGSEEA